MHIVLVLHNVFAVCLCVYLVDCGWLLSGGLLV